VGGLGRAKEDGIFHLGFMLIDYIVVKSGYKTHDSVYEAKWWRKISIDVSSLVEGDNL
jgi:hypothetical protein